MSIALAVLAVVGLAVGGVAWWTARDVEAQLAELTARSVATRNRVVVLREQAALAAQREQELEEAVEAGTSGVRDMHRAISDIPFDVLGSIPATRTASGAVREVHDRTADGVYDAISLVNKAAGGVFRAFRRKP